MPSPFPAPTRVHPLTLPDGTLHAGTVFLRPVIVHPRWEVGDYTYASSFDPPAASADWAARLAPWLHPFSRERLIIGRFCQIADGVRFITSSANHRHYGLSTYPFAIFEGRFSDDAPSLPASGSFRDTVVGNDVWIGAGATILPGARLADGVIVGAGAVVGGTIPPYTIVAGNPARVVRHRVPPETAERLVSVAWWDWPIEAILAAEAAICGTDAEALARAAPRAFNRSAAPPA
jgi:virginiamycin A acetyltransferase